MTDVRSIFVSDVHIGHAKADLCGFLEFLRSHSCEYLYLNGDIIDGWMIKKKWVVTPACLMIFDRIFEMQEQGTKVIVLTGNHDDEIRYLSPFAREYFRHKSDIRLKNMTFHKTADDKKLIVMHGDQFDNIVLRGYLSKYGAYLYDWVSDKFGLYGPAPRIKIDGQTRRFSLARALVKNSGKQALKLMNNFERALRRLVQRKNLDGAVCGHTHVPRLNIRKNGMVIANSGMWIGDRNTAIIETADGTIKLIDWPKSELSEAEFNLKYASHKFSEKTEWAVRVIRHVWKPKHFRLYKSMGGPNDRLSLGKVKNEMNKVVKKAKA